MLTNNARLAQQLAFIVEIDRLKGIIRRAPLIDGSRRENSAEHSWHLALMAMVLAEYIDEPVDVGRTIRLVLVHDIIEIDAGDTFAYDLSGYADKAEREERAAGRIFGLLPGDQAAEFRALWDEFEAGRTAEARFANALDRLMPLLHNYLNEGGVWRENGIGADKVRRRMAPVGEVSVALGDLVEAFVMAAVERGYIEAE
jgi:putative hydrolase of HD superfamily